MAARSSLAAIIARVRLMVNDQGGTPTFSDDQLQDTLDTRRRDVRYLELDAAATLAGPPTSGTVSWLDFYAPSGWWEGDETLISNTYATLSPATSDRVVGHWTFAATQIPPVYIIGKQFDLFGAAADTLEQWVALLKLEYDFDETKDRFFRSQRIAAMTALGIQYRQKAWVQNATMTRDDVPEGASFNQNWVLRPFTTGGR